MRRIDNESILKAPVQCPELSIQMDYAEYVLLHLGKLLLSIESMIKIVLPTGFPNEGNV